MKPDAWFSLMQQVLISQLSDNFFWYSSILRYDFFKIFYHYSKIFKILKFFFLHIISEFVMYVALVIIRLIWHLFLEYYLAGWPLTSQKAKEKIIIFY